MYYLISIILGLLPEVLYFTLFLVITKDLKEKRIRLFLLIGIAYLLCIFIKQYFILFYFAFIFMIYFVLKILYKQKTQIIDVFIITISYTWIAILSFIMFYILEKDMSNYYILYLIDRILLFIPFIFKNNFNKMYEKYCKFWNRNDKEKRNIKSITLRNLSLIFLNSIILIVNYAIFNIINFLK